MEALPAYNAAQQSFTAAFGGVRDSLKQLQDTDAANWQQTKTNNTNAFMDQLRSIDTPEKFAEAQKTGLLDQLRSSYGAQVDSQAIGNAQDARLGILQDRAVKAGVYQDSQDERTQRGDRDAYESLIAQKRYPEAQAVLDKVTFLNEGKMAQAMATAQRTGVEQGQTDAAHGFKVAEAGRAEKMGPLQLEQARQAILNSIDGRATNAAQREEMGARSLLTRAEAEKKLRDGSPSKLLEERTKEVLLRGPLGAGLMGSASGSKEFSDELTKVVKDSTQRDDIVQNLQKYYSKGIVIGKTKEGKDIRIDLPVSLALEGIRSSSDNSLSPNFLGMSRRGDDFDNIIKAKLEDPNYMRELGAAYALQTGRDAPVWNSMLPKPTPDGAAAVSALDAALAASKKKTVSDGQVGIAPVVPALPSGSGEPLNRAVPTAKGSAVTSTEAFSLNNPTVPVKPLDTSKVVWGKAEQVIDAGVQSRKGKAMVLTVGQVTDGDTANLKQAGGKPDLVCRLDGMDARETTKTWKNPPDPGQPYGKEAVGALARLIENKEVSVTVTKAKDDYGRSICQIDVQGTNVTAEMVKAGAAYLTEKFYTEGPDTALRTGEREAYRVLQQAAERNKSGQFSMPTDLTPYEHRKAQKKLQEAYKRSNSQ